MSNWWSPNKQPVVIKQITPTLGLNKKAEYLKKEEKKKSKLENLIDSETRVNNGLVWIS